MRLRTGHEKKSSLKRNLMSEAVGLGAMESDISSIEIFATYSDILVFNAFPITPGGLGPVDAALIALLVGGMAIIKYWWDGRKLREA